jgi:phosphoribosylglycinamide formyltransferase 1
VNWRDFGGDRPAFSHAVARALCTPQAPALVACAGFMRLLSPEFFSHVTCPILNIHPSLLPAFKGAAAQRQALEAGVQVSGATVHFMTAEMDAGGILAQRAVQLYPDDTESTVQERILTAEHALYAQVIAWVLAGVAVPEAGGARVRWRSDWARFRDAGR